MSANLDLVRSIYADWERGDFSRADWADPEIEFVVVGGPTNPDPQTGISAMAQGYREFLSAWQGYRVEAEDYRVLDSERVIVFVHATSGKGKASGVDLSSVRTRGATLFHLRDQRVTRLVIATSLYARART